MYDPSLRGKHTVGIRRITVHDTAFSDRAVPVEVWYPTQEVHRGQDLESTTRDRFSVAPGFPITTQSAVRDAEPADGEFPLVMYCHGGYGHQLECTHLCTHVASHGYVVAAPAFPGDNILDLMPGDADSTAAIAKTPIDESAARRPHQAARLIERILLQPAAVPNVDGERIGVMGFSMGGFTALAVNSVSDRPKAVFAMCPMWGQRSMVPQVARLQKLLNVDDWGRPVATCILTGAVDPMVNVDDMRDLHSRLMLPKRLFILGRAGHLHWVDGAGAAHEQFRQSYLSGEFADPEIDAVALGTAMRPFAELCSEKQAGDTARSLCLAHMDAELEGHVAARKFIDAGAVRTLELLGVQLDTA